MTTLSVSDLKDLAVAKLISKIVDYSSSDTDLSGESEYVVKILALIRKKIALMSIKNGDFEQTAKEGDFSGRSSIDLYQDYENIFPKLTSWKEWFFDYRAFDTRLRLRDLAAKGLYINGFKITRIKWYDSYSIYFSVSWGNYPCNVDYIIYDDDLD